MFPRVPVALIASCALLASACCSSDTSAAPSGTTIPSALTGIVTGIVRHESYLVQRITVPAGPLAGATVTVTEGPGAGASTTTRADGGYAFELPTGPFKVRWSASNYEPRDSDAASVTVGMTTTLAPVTLRLLSNVPIPEWSVSGTIRDGLGNPVAGASVYAGDSLYPTAGAQTDGSGFFRITSTRQHLDPLAVFASKSGYAMQSSSVACGPLCAATVNFRMLRLVREWLDAPSTMKVGDITRVSTVDEYDDGTRNVFNAYVHSSNAAVVEALDTQAPDYKTYVKAIAPGDATLQVAASQTLVINVHVVP